MLTGAKGQVWGSRRRRIRRRKHIESLGYRIVANVGDQLSDLQGDHEQRAVKLPIRMYFIP